MAWMSIYQGKPGLLSGRSAPW